MLDQSNASIRRENKDISAAVRILEKDLAKKQADVKKHMDEVFLYGQKLCQTNFKPVIVLILKENLFRGLEKDSSELKHSLSSRQGAIQLLSQKLVIFD